MFDHILGIRKASSAEVSIYCTLQAPRFTFVFNGMPLRKWHLSLIGGVGLNTEETNLIYCDYYTLLPR